MANNIGVHAAHCCAWHGCKYGDEDCPVVLGQVEQLYTCDYCDDELADEEYFKNVVKRIEEIKAWKARKKAERENLGR